MDIPYNPAAERNRAPILECIAAYLERTQAVLEIGAGSGQHAVYCAAHLRHLHWHASEQAAGLCGLQAQLAASGLRNLGPALVLDVTRQPWPQVAADAVFSANTIHCMTWSAACDFFAGVAELLPAHGVFLLYGPFNCDGEFTSDGNQRLDAWARGLDPGFGLRDRVALAALAADTGMRLCEDHALPANNRLLVWRPV